jgi:hypothetical protein
VYPTMFRPMGAVLGAEALHEVFRGWLTDLDHPSPTAAEQSTVESVTS